MTPHIYLGLMSGTSMDGVDGLAVDFSDAARPHVLGETFVEFPPELKTVLHRLQSSGPDEIHHEALAANALAQRYAAVCERLLTDNGIARDRVRAVGVHGQTIRHRPELGFTRQTNNPALVAELTGIDVVADFRSRDVAAGGHGAPLAPAFHATMFGAPGKTRVVCNIGGISNITVLAADGAVTGFDCGPGNALMDYWVNQHRAMPYDEGGAFAASGAVDDTLLDALLEDPYFVTAPPKSTGRDLFNPDWLSQRLGEVAVLPDPADVQATLAALTAETIAHDVARHAPSCEAVYVCGGGAYNLTLMSMLDASLNRRGLRAEVHSTAALGVPPHHVEAFAFAWLAYRFIHREPGNLVAVTGARGPRVLGALYPR
ncbi:anhydro-N-acetylmuramic acid kinase [Pararobbsia silviterrae]|uniref:Anhydro-N-acetylmuramic acid kinase n=1 Tax=Pararobbsia silviterrae TaxID=1792498 RepID=A0A494YDX5_9BURK|nr:anhydro-N-acetylmuramic acid kinase [Pararobbsia silviterrae]RKP58928.1 anhydro-N-acetylmuramic acid kinase [Pararobbsia silviterrae]